jgi:hypothetical protein
MSSWRICLPTGAALHVPIQRRRDISTGDWRVRQRRAAIPRANWDKLRFSGNTWVTDDGNSRVQEFNSDGTFLQAFGSYGSGNGQFYQPFRVAVDYSGNVWVLDTGNNRIEEFSLVPEPSTFALAAFGGGLWLAGRTWRHGALGKSRLILCGGIASRGRSEGKEASMA